MKKIIAIVIIGMFLLSGFMIPPVFGKETALILDLDMAINLDNGRGNERWGLLIEYPYFDEIKPLTAILCRNGWQKDHIQTIPGENLTRTNVVEKFSWLETHSAITDTVLITIGSHGSNGSFKLKPGHGRMSYSDLNDQINRITAREIAIIVNTCHSGSAIPYLQKKDRVIMTSCRANETAGGFTRYFGVSLQGFSDYEGNNDGFVSAEESFDYILKDWSCDSHPQMQDNRTGELKLTTVNSSFVDKKNIDIYINHDWYSNFAMGWNAQSFKPNYDRLTKIKLLLYLHTDADLYFSIKKGLDGANLTSKIIPGYTFSNLDHHVDRFIEVDFPDIDVVPGETYYIVWYSPSVYGYEFGCPKNDEYPDGNLFYAYWEDKIWRSIEGMDYLFITYGNKTNHPPNVPTISGPSSGKPNKEYSYIFNVTDPNGDDISSYTIDWGDDNVEVVEGPFASGEEITVSHIWDEQGTYTIKAKAKDIHGAESDWGTLTVTMPKNQQSIPQQSQQSIPQQMIMLRRLPSNN